MKFCRVDGLTMRESGEVVGEREVERARRIQVFGSAQADTHGARLLVLRSIS
jgi:hypothetical protein